MYKNFDDAKSAALKTISNNYNGENHGCCITETKLSQKARKTFWGFRFNSKDSNGKFVPNGDGSYSRLYEI